MAATMTAEQKVLLDLVNARIAEMQQAVKVAMPGATSLHEEFLVGSPPASTPAEAVRIGRAVEPAAREYRALLLNRGLDAAELKRFERALEDLEKLNAAQPAPEAPAPAEPKKLEKKSRKKTEKKASGARRR